MTKNQYILQSLSQRKDSPLQLAKKYSIPETIIFCFYSKRIYIYP
jgi:hypothetical protein